MSFIEVSRYIPGLIEYPKKTACVGAKIGLAPMIKAGFLRENGRAGLCITLAATGAASLGRRAQCVPKLAAIFIHTGSCTGMRPGAWRAPLPIV